MCKAPVGELSLLGNASYKLMFLRLRLLQEGDRWSMDSGETHIVLEKHSSNAHQDDGGSRQTSIVVAISTRAATLSCDERLFKRWKFLAGLPDRRLELQSQ